jgi:hypothetical protein
MEFNLVSKNNLGCVSTIFFVILLSQIKIFNFLIDTTLGRAILILFILGISYIHKILGVVAVLFLIISFNNINIGYMEGFDNSANIKGKKDEIKDEKNKNIQEKVQQPKRVNKNMESIEGYNMIEREGMIIRGKNSNEVPVFANVRHQDDNVAPIDNSVFTNSYTSV